MGDGGSNGGLTRGSAKGIPDRVGGEKNGMG